MPEPGGAGGRGRATGDINDRPDWKYRRVYGRCPRRFSPTSRGVIAMTPDEPTVAEVVKAPEAAPAVEAVPTEAPAVEAPADAPAAVEAPKTE